VRLPNRNAIFVLVFCAFGFGEIWYRPLVWGVIGTLVVFGGVMIYERMNYQAASARWLALARRDPIVLHPPFRDRWFVSSGGPDPRFNHHAFVTDQRFAYDFLREGGDEWDQPILAPCDGMVAHVESRRADASPAQARRDRERPFGNYISIQTPRGYVLLAHLKAGSVSVRVGDSVRAGDEIARCGNSGTTRGAHLHVHAQNQPSQSIDVAEGIPIAFVRREGAQPELLEHGDAL